MAMLKFKAESTWTEADPAVKVRSGKHEFFIDEPASVGGADKGPNPLQYVIGSLTGCVTIVGRKVAKNMGITLHEISVSIEGDIDDRGFTGQDPNVPKGFQEMRLVFKVKSDAPREKIEEWMRATENLCPVGNTYRDGTRVKMELAN